MPSHAKEIASLIKVIVSLKMMDKKEEKAKKLLAKKQKIAKNKKNKKKTKCSSSDSDSDDSDSDSDSDSD